MENGKIFGVLHAGRRKIDSISFSPDGNSIVSGSTDGFVRIWKTMLVENTNQAQGDRGGEAVHSFAMSGNGERVLVQTVDRKISVWNALDGRKTYEEDISGIFSCIALDESGEVAAYGLKSGTESFYVRQWNRYQRYIRRTSSTGRVLRLSFSRDGSQIVSIGVDDSIRVRNVEKDMLIICEIEENSEFAHDVAFSADGTLVIWTNIFSAVKIWRVDSGALVFHSVETSQQIMSTDEAVTVLQACGSKSSTMWLESLDCSRMDIFLGDGGGVYCPRKNDKELLALFPTESTGVYPAIRRRKFCRENGTLVSTARGRLVICRLLRQEHSSSRPEKVSHRNCFWLRPIALLVLGLVSFFSKNETASRSGSLTSDGQ